MMADMFAPPPGRAGRGRVADGCGRARTGGDHALQLGWGPPTPYLRVLINLVLLRCMGLTELAADLERV